MCAKRGWAADRPVHAPREKDRPHPVHQKKPHDKERDEEVHAPFPFGPERLAQK